MQDFLNTLNEQQRTAVLYCDGPQLVIAGAGSGKTRVLTYKIAHLLQQGMLPHNILALTFTNKAAREMRQRVQNLVPGDLAGRLWMGTFHSIFARILRINSERIAFPHNFTIYDQNDSKSLIKLVVNDLSVFWGKALTESEAYKPALLQAQISNMKNALIGPEQYAADGELREMDNVAGRPEFYRIYEAYCQRCRIAGAMDFDDLLYCTNIMLRDCPDLLEQYQQLFQYILVDEYQDTNFAQHAIVLQLSRGHNRICVVGDDAQSIYSFRGANITNILQLDRFYPGLVIHKLEQNYRSTQTITAAANSLIEHNREQINKHLFSQNAVGEKIKVVKCWRDQDEAAYVANYIAALKARQGGQYRDFAVLYRTNAQSRAIEQAFSTGGMKNKHGNMRDAIPYRVYGGLSFFQRKEVKDALAYFRLSVNPDDDEALRRVINYPPRGIGEATMAKVQHCAIQAGTSLWHAITHPRQVALDVNRGTQRKLDEFASLIREFADMTAAGADAYGQAKAIIERTRILAVLMGGDRTPENLSRIENLEELANSVHEFVEIMNEQGDGQIQMPHYLAAVSLLTDQDNDDADGDDDFVTLMTVHAAKGLEFKNVIIVGVEEDLFPSAMSKDTLSGIEEERRLLYVAITRAVSTCLITYATLRFRFGTTRNSVMSRFLREIAPEFVHMPQEPMGRGEADDDAPYSRRATPIERPRPRPSLAEKWAPTGTESAFAPQIRPATSPGTTTADGQCTTHAADELAPGMTIRHTHFGCGVVRRVDKADGRIYVHFADKGQKTLMLKYARFQILDTE